MIKINEVSDIDIYKQNYINRRNRENAEIAEGKLTEEQIDAIEWLCEVRHNIHSNMDSYFNSESDVSWDIFDKINETLYSVGLDTIDFPNLDTIPTDIDYYEFLSDDERDEWEGKAEDIKGHTGFSLWMEESGEYAEFLDAMENINDCIENYLQQIDKENGTHYAPTGVARNRYFN